MKPDELIEDSVELLKKNYFRKMLKTKILFFNCLQKHDSREEFIAKFNTIWKNLDYQFMNNRIKELERLIDTLNNTNPVGETVEFLELIEQKKFDDTFKNYSKIIFDYYELRIKTVEKGINDVSYYLSNFVDKYDKYEASIPYFNKDGTIHSWHDIADYNSMLFNTNLLRCSINRTLYDAKYLGKDLIYIPAHNGSCPKCMKWQGRIYSLSGNDDRYPSLDVPYSNGLGHPNCKHVSVICWDESQIQSDRYDSEEWKEEYKIDQKKKALRREIAKKNTDLKIFKKLNEQSKIDLTKVKLKKLRSRLSEL